MRRSKHGPDPETPIQPKPPQMKGKRKPFPRTTTPITPPSGLEARVPPPHERALRRATITAMLNECASPETIIEDCSKKFGMSAALTREWMARIKGERSDQFAQDRGKYKAEQVMRLQADLTAMRRMKVPPYATIARFEELLIRIVGTAEPVKIETTVNVSVRESIVACIQHMDDSALDAITIEQLELEAVAKSARALMGMGSLDTVGEAVIGQGEDVAKVPSN